MFITTPNSSPDTNAYPASQVISGRPPERGRQPAPKPTQPAAIIWNGSQGPTPPVISAPTNKVTAPSTKPNPRPNTRPPRMITAKLGSRPAVPGPRVRSAPPTAASIPSIATALASTPPAVSSASTTAASSGRISTKIIGASPECEVSRAEPGLVRNGQPNATIPTTNASVSASADRN